MWNPACSAPTAHSLLLFCHCVGRHMICSYRRPRSLMARARARQGQGAMQWFTPVSPKQQSSATARFDAVYHPLSASGQMTRPVKHRAAAWCQLYGFGGAFLSGRELCWRQSHCLRWLSPVNQPIHRACDILDYHLLSRFVPQAHWMPRHATGLTSLSDTRLYYRQPSRTS